MRIHCRPDFTHPTHLFFSSVPSEFRGHDIDPPDLRIFNGPHIQDILPETRFEVKIVDATHAIFHLRAEQHEQREHERYKDLDVPMEWNPEENLFIVDGLSVHPEELNAVLGQIKNKLDWDVGSNMDTDAARHMSRFLAYIHATVASMAILFAGNEAQATSKYWMAANPPVRRTSKELKIPEEWQIWMTQMGNLFNPAVPTKKPIRLERIKDTSLPPAPAPPLVPQK